MPTNKEILESLKEINAALAATIADAERNGNILFYREGIKQSALHIFERAQLLNNASAPEPKAPVEVKVIRQEEVAPEKEIAPIRPEPVTPEPVAPLKIESIPVAEAPKVEIEKPKPSIPAVKVSITREEVVDDASVNAKIAKFQQPVMNLADKLKDTPIKELVKAISISRKFEFINELFGGKADVYKASLQAIESSGSFQQAADYIENEIADTYNWNENEKLAAEFFLLVKRRFL